MISFLLFKVFLFLLLMTADLLLGLVLPLDEPHDGEGEQRREQEGDDRRGFLCLRQDGREAGEAQGRQADRVLDRLLRELPGAARTSLSRNCTGAISG